MFCDHLNHLTQKELAGLALNGALRLELQKQVEASVGMLGSCRWTGIGGMAIAQMEHECWWESCSIPGSNEFEEMQIEVSTSNLIHLQSEAWL